MSNKQDTNKSNIVEPKFDENRAYEELRMIFVIAIETQDFSTLEARIAAWEKKYPLADFTDPEIIRKIKAILNKDFLSRLLGDYLSAKILHEQEKQKEAYDSLKKIIDTAKKSKDYKTAQREIRKWKNTLNENGFNLYSFDRLYRAKVCTLLLLPSKELKNQEQATDELNRLKEDSKSMDSKTLFEAISKWQNTYSIPDFPDKLQKELNKTTTEVFDSISQKRTSENAILEIETVLSSHDTTLPVDSIATILSKYDYKLFPQEAINTIENLTAQAMSIQDSLLENDLSDVDFSAIHHISPVEATALSSLRDIINRTPHDMDSILNWIYVNRKINYSDIAREEILKQFSSVGYKVAPQSSYSIPDINPNLGYQNFSEIDEIRKSVILNYLGIISQGNKLSLQGKDNIQEAHTVSTQIEFVEEETKPTLFLEVFDTIVEQPELDDDNTYDEKGALDIDEEEEIIYNIFIEDIIDNPVTTYSFVTPTPEKIDDLSPSTTTSDKITTSNTIQEVVVNTDIIKPIQTQSQTSASEEVTISSEIENNNIEYSETDSTTPSDNTDSENPLNTQDDENIEQAYDLSTYIVVASPILTQALEQKRTRSYKKIKDIERIK